MARPSMRALVGVASRARRQEQQRNRGTATYFLHSATAIHANILVLPPSAAAAAAVRFNGGGGGGVRIGTGIIRCRPSSLVGAAASVGVSPWLSQYQAARKWRSFYGPAPTGTVQGSRGTYKFGKQLGYGAFGEIYLCENVDTLEKVAIKTMPNYWLKSADFKMRVRVTREISAMMQVRHPYITRLLDVVYNPADPDGRLCMVMEYMEGGNLHDYVQNCLGRRLPEDKARTFFQQLIDGLSFCHKMDIVHRDLQPRNLLLDATCTTLKIADFGLSMLDISAAGPLTSPVGTMGFKAPEVEFSYQHSEVASHQYNWCSESMPLLPANAGYDGTAADVWSCGVILIYFIGEFSHTSRGRWKDSGQDEDEIYIEGLQFPPDFPPGPKSLIRGMLHHDPAQRMKVADIYRDPWFMTDYTAPDYKLVPEVKENLQAIDDVFKMPTDAKYDTNPAGQMSITLPRPTRAWKHRERPVDEFVFGSNTGHGEKEFIVHDHSFKMHSTLHPSVLIKVLRRALNLLGCRYRIRQFTIHVYDDRDLRGPIDLGEPLEMLIDVVSDPLSKGRYIIHIRRVTGLRWQFNEITRRIAKVCKIFMRPI